MGREAPLAPERHRPGEWPPTSTLTRRRRGAAPASAAGGGEAGPGARRCFASTARRPGSGPSPAARKLRRKVGGADGVPVGAKTPRPWAAAPGPPAGLEADRGGPALGRGRGAASCAWRPPGALCLARGRPRLVSRRVASPRAEQTSDSRADEASRRGRKPVVVPSPRRHLPGRGSRAGPRPERRRGPAWPSRGLVPSASSGRPRASGDVGSFTLVQQTFWNAPCARPRAMRRTRPEAEVSGGGRPACPPRPGHGLAGGASARHAGAPRRRELPCRGEGRSPLRHFLLVQRGAWHGCCHLKQDHGTWMTESALECTFPVCLTLPSVNNSSYLNDDSMYATTVPGQP